MLTPFLGVTYRVTVVAVTEVTAVTAGGTWVHELELV